MPESYKQYKGSPENLLFEIVIPRNLSIGQVEEPCHKECIKIEDEYDLFILPKVIYEE